jgi:single-strand DNA-binding protein
MFNKVILIGNLTKDPELRYTPQGTAVGNFRIAVSSKFRSGDEQKEETLFIDIVVWGKQGENCSQYLNKGRSVLVEGRLQERKWETDGQKRSKFEVVAQNVRFLGKKDSGSSYSQTGQSDPGQPPDEITDIEPF